MTNTVDNGHLKRIITLLLYFSILAFYFLTYTPGYNIWIILIISAIAWLVSEIIINKKQIDEIKKALTLGAFLLVFDFIVENTGAYFNFWQVKTTILHVLAVPIEVMLVCLIGGAAWALAQPKALNRTNMFFDVLLFSIFGMIGEITLIKNNIMFYSNGWTSIHAFVGYAITWIILYFIWYLTIKKQN